jgi:hypothetical protein
MEIISIPLKGALSHKDSMGNKRAIEVDEVQVMSAGTGLTHSEFNDSKNRRGEFFAVVDHSGGDECEAKLRAAHIRQGGAKKITCK